MFSMNNTIQSITSDTIKSLNSCDVIISLNYNHNQLEINRVMNKEK